MAFIGRNSKEIRWPEIQSAAQGLKSEHGFKKLGAIGFCYGGWAVFQLGAKSKPLVDCISMCHPSLLEKSEIEAVGVPTQIIAPENDFQLTPELKTFCNETIPTLGVEYDYQYFPGLTHGFGKYPFCLRPCMVISGVSSVLTAMFSWLFECERITHTFLHSC